MEVHHHLMAVMLLCLMTLSSFGQKLFDKQGVVTFFSSAPLENIDAKNERVLAVLDVQSGEVAVSMMMREFVFPKSLMQEHFNENYMESEKYPKATFSGKLQDFRWDEFNVKRQGTFIASGQLTIHGVTKPLETPITINIIENKITVNTSFDVRVADHKIKIPKLVVMNIAEVVEVKGTFIFDKP